MLKIVLVIVLTAVTYALMYRRNSNKDDTSKHNIPLLIGLGVGYYILIMFFVGDKTIVGGGQDVIGSEYEKHIVQGIRDDCQVGVPPF